MEPISLSVAALTAVNVLSTKALGKIGEAFGQKTVEHVGKLKQLLQRKSPETATAIETVTKQPELAEVTPSEYGAKALAERIEKIAEADPEIAEAITSLANTVNVQSQSVQQNNTTITGNVGVNAPGGTVNYPTINI